MATRKKLQKLFALLLVLSMTMGMLNITAFAAGGDGEEHSHNAITCETCEGTGKETVSCEDCGGTGRIESAEMCNQCDGTGGYMSWVGMCPVCHGATGPGESCEGGCLAGNIYETIACTACNGTGYASETCSKCNGEGVVQTDNACLACSGTGTVPCTGEFAGEVTTAATCVTAGVMTYTCATCGAEYTEAIPVDATAHQWGEPVALAGQEPTCGAGGMGIRTCALCNQTEEVAMPATGQHVYGDDLKCTVCGAAEPADEDTAAVIALLEALPGAENVTADDRDAIKAARAAYDALTDHQKKFVSEELLTALTDAEKALSGALVAQADALLAALPDDLTSDMGAVFAAYNAVSTLSEAEKAQLTQADKLAALNGYLGTMDLYSYFKEGTSAPGAWVVYDTTVGVAAPKGTSFSGNPATFAFVKGTSNLSNISRHLPSGCTMDAAFQMSPALVKAAKALEDGQEIVVTIQSSLTESVSSYDVYFISGSSSRENCSLIEETTLSNGTLVVRLNNQNYKNLSYIALTRSMEYTDNYTTPDSAANSYVPADHAASSDGITYGYRMDGDTRVITVTIPADYTGDTVNINMAAIREVFGQLGVGFVENGQTVAGGFADESTMEAMGKDYIEPGQALAHRIEIINLSSQKYAYTSGSLWMDVAKLENYMGYEDASGVYPAFDGNGESFAVYRTWNKALSALLDSTSDVLDDATINAALQAIYKNEDGIEVNLPHYYLDFYNFAYNTNVTTLEQLPADALFDLFGGEKDMASSSSDGAVYSRETLPELNNLAYNFFYTRAFQLEQSSSTASDYSTSVGAAMAGQYNVLDTKAAAAWDELSAAASEPAAMEFTVTPAGPLWNAYMRYPVACDMGFTLEKVVEPSGGGGSYSYYDVTINYYDQDGNVIYSQYVSPDIREGGSWDYSSRQLETITVGDVTYTFSYADGDPITGTNIRRDQVVNLYYSTESDLEDPDVPQGELPDEPGTDLEDPDVPMGELPDEDVPKADAPETGDISGLWLALSALSGTGLAGVTLLGRKKRDEE